MLAMHMADNLLTPPVAMALNVVAVGVLAWSARQTHRRFDPARVPLMGVLGAFVFAAQMINFPVLPGTRGHLGGGLLLALVLGPHAAALVMASILIVQCLIFQDGGLLALGANIINLGLMPCYLGYGVYRLLAGAAPRPGRAYAALFIAAVAGCVAGAALVPLEVRVSNLLAVPFSEFLLLMIGLHLLIALGEAFITFAVVGYLGRVRPQLVASAVGLPASSGRLGARAVAASVFVVSLLLAGLISLYASEWPDALESLTSGGERRSPAVLPNSSPTVQRVEDVHQRLSPLPDYGGIKGWTSAPGVIGTIVVLIVVWLIGRSLRPAARPGHPHRSAHL
ncbi:MAG: hypothetical protein AMXMBFR83_18550 [Phycisphaerae bacterium]